MRYICLSLIKGYYYKSKGYLIGYAKKEYLSKSWVWNMSKQIEVNDLQKFEEPEWKELVKGLNKHSVLIDGKERLYKFRLHEGIMSAKSSGKMHRIFTPSEFINMMKNRGRIVKKSIKHKTMTPKGISLSILALVLVVFLFAYVVPKHVVPALTPNTITDTSFDDFLKTKDTITCIHLPKIAKIAEKHGINPTFLMAIILVETGCDQSMVSDMGAYGIGQVTQIGVDQLNKPTSKPYLEATGFDTTKTWDFERAKTEPEYNALAAAAYLVIVRDLFIADKLGPKDETTLLEFMAAGYNGRPPLENGDKVRYGGRTLTVNRLKVYIDAGRKDFWSIANIPNHQGGYPLETRNYVRKVMSYKFILDNFVWPTGYEGEQKLKVKSDATGFSLYAVADGTISNVWDRSMKFANVDEDNNYYDVTLQHGKPEWEFYTNYQFGDRVPLPGLGYNYNNLEDMVGTKVKRGEYVFDLKYLKNTIEAKSDSMLVEFETQNLNPNSEEAYMVKRSFNWHTDVQIYNNLEDKASGTVVREHVPHDRKLPILIKTAYELRESR